MLLALAVMAGLRATVGFQTLPELVSDTIIFLIPPTIFSFLLDALRFDAKLLLLLGLVVAQILLGSLGGAFLAGRIGTVEPRNEFRTVLRPALVFALTAWFVTVAVILPIVSAGFLGSDTEAGPILTTVGFLLVFLTWGLSFAWLYVQLSATSLGPEKRGLTRRALIKQMGIGLLAIVAAGTGLRVVANLSPRVEPAAELPPPITPTDSFYVVGKNLIGVNVDLGRWRLNVIGSGSHVGQLDLSDLKALPTTNLVSTLTCISNLVGGDLIGTTKWTGVRVSDVIGSPGAAENIRNVVFTGWDDYADSIPIEKALDPSTILAYAMNGEPLRPEHGYPLRLVVPGRYGIKNVKWVRRIEVMEHGFVGYWQARGWTDQAIIQTQSQIDLPRDGSTHPIGPIQVGGIAFAGDRGIRGVELSVDGGRNWAPTTLQSPLSAYSWTTWTLMWSPSETGLYGIVVRATDGTGQLQPSGHSAPIPDGATGLHGISVRIR